MGSIPTHSDFPAGPKNNGNGLILSVDDEALLLYTRQKLLEAEGYGVLSAVDGEHALQFFSAAPIDLVLLDFAMPGMDGATVAEKMKAQKPHVPVILVSAINHEEEGIPSVDGFFSKGEDPGILLAKIKQLLAPPPAE